MGRMRALLAQGQATAHSECSVQIINPNLWQPLSIYNPKLGVNITQKFTTPQWINVTSFALTCGTQFLSPAADVYQYGSLGYVAQARGYLMTFLGSGRAVFLVVGALGCWRIFCVPRKHASLKQASPSSCHTCRLALYRQAQGLHGLC